MWMSMGIWPQPNAYINLVNDNDPAEGLGFNDDPPRFSTGYVVLEGRPGIGCSRAAYG